MRPHVASRDRLHRGCIVTGGLLIDALPRRAVLCSSPLMVMEKGFKKVVASASGTVTLTR